MRPSLHSPASPLRRISSQTVAVTATATDSESGVNAVTVRLNGHGRYGYSYARLKRDGDQWVGQAKIKQCVKSGEWKATVYLNDGAGNYKAYRSHALEAADLPFSISVTSTPGDSNPPEVDNATAAGAEHTITLNFSEGVKNVSDSTLRVYAMKPASTRYTSSTSISSITCGDGISTVPCDGSGNLVTSARLTVPDVVGGARFQVWANLDNLTPQLTDGAGNPLRWDYSVAQVTGS
jgi:hypothetical protein